MGLHCNMAFQLAFSLQEMGARFRMPYQENYVLWKIIGYVGMLLFFTRFIVQWLYSEKHKESKVPTIFWWQSLLGAIFMLAYSLRQQDSPYIFGYLLTVIPYLRNLILIYRKPKTTKELEIKRESAAAGPLVGAAPAPA